MKTEKKPSSYREKLKKALGFLIKLALAGGIVLYLVWHNPKEIIEGFKTFDYIWLLPAALIYFAHMVVCSLRWYALTKVLKLKLTAKESIYLSMQAYFFSLVVPGGAIGGDLVKIGVLSSRADTGTKVEGAFSILMDRIVGMIALFVTVIAVAIPAIPTLMKISLPDIPLSDGTKELLIAGLFALCFAGLAASAAVFFHRILEKIPPIGFLMHKTDHWSGGMLSRVTAATDQYRAHWPVLVKTVLISIPFVHLMTVVSFSCIVAGLHVDGASLLTVIAAITIGNVVGLLPLFPSGVGGRDVAAIAILVAGGMESGDAKTAQLLYTALLLFANLVGGLFFIIDPGKKKNQAVEPALEEPAK